MQMSGWLNSAEKRTETEPEIWAEKTQLLCESKPDSSHVMVTSNDLEKQAGVDEKPKALGGPFALKRMILMVPIMFFITTFVVNYVTKDFRELSVSQEWREVPQSVWKENERMRNYLEDYDKNLINKFSLYGGLTFSFGAMAFASCSEIITLFTKKAEIVENSTLWYWKAGLISSCIVVILNSICARFFAADFYSLWKEFLAVSSFLRNLGL